MNQSQPNATCSSDYASWFDCRFNVEEEYLERIKRACNNKTACDANLTAECNAKTMYSEACSFLTAEPRDITCADYVMMVYKCHAIAHEWTRESTEVVTLFTTAPESTDRGISNSPNDSSSQLSTALIVGLSMGMCLCAVIIALVVIVVKGKRVQPVLKSNNSNPVCDEQKVTSGPEVPNSVPLYENPSPRSLAMDSEMSAANHFPFTWNCDIVPFNLIPPDLTCYDPMHSLTGYSRTAECSDNPCRPTGDSGSAHNGKCHVRSTSTLNRNLITKPFDHM